MKARWLQRPLHQGGEDDVAKRAFIIIGSESSGTKLLAKAFSKAGAAGDAWHKQRFDETDPTEPVVFLRRSYPHGGEWPELAELVERFGKLGYEVQVVVIVRSMRFTMASRETRHGVTNAMERARGALAAIGAQLAATGVPFVWVTYEELVQRPKLTLGWLFDWAGLKRPLIKVRDENEKYV